MKLRALPNRLRRGQGEPQRKPTITDVIQIVANVGVIASIVFLAIELHQNNEVLNAQARHERAQTRVDALTDLMNNAELRTARIKDMEGAPLSADERLILQVSWEVLLARWQYVYGELQAGLIEPEDIPVGGWRRAVNAYPSFHAAWEDTKNLSYRADFVDWMERNVVEPATALPQAALTASPAPATPPVTAQ